MRAIVILLFAAFLLPAAANAEVDLELYQKAKSTGGDTWKRMEYYVKGVGRGIYLTAIFVDNDKKFLCPPKKYSPAGGQFIQWLDQGLEQLPKDLLDTLQYIEPVLYIQMREVFPCE